MLLELTQGKASNSDQFCHSANFGHELCLFLDAASRFC